MVFATLYFSVIASKHSTATGLVDYAEAVHGKNLAFKYIGFLQLLSHKFFERVTSMAYHPLVAS